MRAITKRLAAALRAVLGTARDLNPVSRRDERRLRLARRVLDAARRGET